ncbi:MotA/TolQ/ExbB proton channel family protein [Ectothiorhodospiraceae bacterium BW-2]|nr:MotA/TolQ/ExbB proton channel family protein [Ectothiorhodospiraceae bacterium BW-2]
MLELMIAGGWLMVPILLCSIFAMTIIIERLLVLRQRRIAPPNLVNGLWKLHIEGKLTNQHIEQLALTSPLGRVLAAGLTHLTAEREVMKEVIEEAGRQAVGEMERYLNALGTIASITPLLGLLGTVIGMIKVFAAITAAGVGDPTILAGGISEALITTATGLSVAIVSLAFYRHFRHRVDMLALRMEEEALRLVEMIHGERPVSR